MDAIETEAHEAAEGESEAEEGPSAREWHERWVKELGAAHKEVAPWHEEGKDIVSEFLVEDGENSSAKGLHLFTVNIDTQLALLFGTPTPKVSAERRFADASDDAARVAGLLLERGLNADVERAGDTYVTALKNALRDRLLPGCGIARVRYEVKYEDVPARPAMMSADGREMAPAVPASKKKVYECVHVDYVHWKDFRWTPARVWSPDVRWVAFGNDMSKEQLVSRFGEEIAEGVPLNSPTAKDKEEARKDPLARARVWEVWDAASRKVFWVCEGAGACLDIQDDPLKLDRFFPCPEPMFSILSTSKVLPTPDYRVAKHLYQEVDSLTERISLLTEALRVAGVYDNANPQIKRLLTEDKKKNHLVAVDNWARLGEKGGLRGAIEFLPLQEVVAAIASLQQQRLQAKQDLYEVTGLSDILRGQGQGPGVTLGEQEIKAQFGSIRIQKVLEDFARFASELQGLKAEVMARLFDTESILKQANAEHMEEEPALLQAAAALIKEQFAYYRIAVRPESVSAQAFAQLQAEQTQLMEEMVTFIQGVAPIAQQMPGSMPFLLKMLQAHVAGRRGGARMEGIIDAAIKSAEQAAANPQQSQPDPKVVAQQMKGQQEKEKAQTDLQGDLIRIQAETQAKAQQESVQREQNVMEAAQKMALANAMKPKVEPSNGGMPR